MKRSLKELSGEIRMLVVVKLAYLIIKFAPDNPEGLAWVAAIHVVTEQQLRG